MSESGQSFFPSWWLVQAYYSVASISFGFPGGIHVHFYLATKYDSVCAKSWSRQTLLLYSISFASITFLHVCNAKYSRSRPSSLIPPSPRNRNASMRHTRWRCLFINKKKGEDAALSSSKQLVDAFHHYSAAELMEFFFHLWPLIRSIK